MIAKALCHHVRKNGQITIHRSHNLQHKQTAQTRQREAMVGFDITAGKPKNTIIGNVAKGTANG